MTASDRILAQLRLTADDLADLDAEELALTQRLELIRWLRKLPELVPPGRPPDRNGAIVPAGPPDVLPPSPAPAQADEGPAPRRSPPPPLGLLPRHEDGPADPPAPAADADSSADGPEDTEGPACSQPGRSNRRTPGETAALRKRMLRYLGREGPQIGSVIARHFGLSQGNGDRILKHEWFERGEHDYKWRPTWQGQAVLNAEKEDG